MRWKYSTFTVGGNFHSAVNYLNMTHPEWDVVAMEVVGHYTIIVYREVI